MLTTHEPDPTKTAGTIDEYRQSETVKRISEELAQRYYRGGVKYGVFVDEMVVPTEITGERSFAEMAKNELLDGLTYAFKAMDAHEEQEKLMKRAGAALHENAELIGRLRDKLEDAQNVIAAQEEKIKQLEDELRLVEQAREAALAEGDLSREQEAELVHRNVQLEIQVEELKKGMALHRGRADRLGHSAKQLQEIAKQRLEKLDKIPALVKRVYGV